MLGVKAYNSFGMTEMNGPGVAFECTEQNGMHFWEDCYFVEIIDPETGEPVPEGEIGELVLTTLDREMMPLLRYRTRDLTRILPGKCPCGRTHLRIDRIKGRSDDMFIIKGVNIFPMQVEKILVQFPKRRQSSKGKRPEKQYIINTPMRQSGGPPSPNWRIGISTSSANDTLICPHFPYSLCNY